MMKKRRKEIQRGKVINDKLEKERGIEGRNLVKQQTTNNKWIIIMIMLQVKNKWLVEEILYINGYKNISNSLKAYSWMYVGKIYYIGSAGVLLLLLILLWLLLQILYYCNWPRKSLIGSEPQDNRLLELMNKFEVLQGEGKWWGSVFLQRYDKYAKSARKYEEKVTYYKYCVW